MRNFLRRALFEGEVIRLMGITLLIKPIGVVTQMLLANYYGAGRAYDAYALAFFLISFVDLTIGRVFTAAIVPYTIKLKETLDPRRLFAFQNATYLLFLLPGVLYVLLLFLRSEWPLLIAARNAPPETRQFAARMLRWMAVPGILLLLVALLKSTLNLHRRFRLPAGMPLVNGLLFLAVVILGHARMGIWALPLAVAVGAAAQAVVLGVASLTGGQMAPVRPRLPDGAAAAIWSLSWMIFISTTFQTVNAFLDKMFAAGLEAGSISSISYSMIVVNSGLQLFSLSLVTVMFTRMSELIASGRIGACVDYIRDNMIRISRLVVPGALALALCSGEIVQVLYERGAFTAADTARTSGVLMMYLLGLPAMIINSVVTRIFHSLQKMKAKMWLALQFLLTNVLGNILLIGSLKVMGLAVSSTIAINVHLWLSVWVLRRYDGLGRGSILPVISRAYGLAVVVWLIYRFSGFGAWADALFAGDPDLGQALLTAAIRAAFVLGLYWILYAFARRWFVIRSRPR